MSEKREQSAETQRDRCPTKHICGHTCDLLTGHEGNHVDAAHFVQWEEGGYPHSLGHEEPTLDKLLESARKHEMTPEEKEAQRQSWVRGEAEIHRKEKL